jgi:purine-binding chemotaxis protein CheW
MPNKSLRRRLRQIDRGQVLSAEERVQLILDERTERLARRSDRQAATTTDTIQVLVCGVGSERYGIPLAVIAEVLPDQTYVPVLDAPPALVGVLGRSNHLVSVIDLGRALENGARSNTENPTSEEGHLVLLRRDSPRVALRVDRAYGIAAVIPPTQDKAQTFRNDAVIGYAEARSGFADQERVLSLIDVDRLLHPYLSSPVPGV